MKTFNVGPGRIALIALAGLIGGVLAVGLGASLFTSSNDSSTTTVVDTASPSPTPWPTPTTALNVKTAGNHVFTYVCEIPNSYKPDVVYFACADGNTGIRGIRWTTWTPLSAQGTGEYFENNCTPDCAEGKFSFTPVALWLDTPIQMGREIYLTQLGYQQIDATGRIVNSGIGGNNDMAAMYINMYTETASPTPSANSSK